MSMFGNLPPEHEPPKKDNQVKVEVDAEGIAWIPTAVKGIRVLAQDFSVIDGANLIKPVKEESPN